MLVLVPVAFSATLTNSQTVSGLVVTSKAIKFFVNEVVQQGHTHVVCLFAYSNAQFSIKPIITNKLGNQYRDLVSPRTFPHSSGVGYMTCHGLNVVSSFEEITIEWGLSQGSAVTSTSNDPISAFAIIGEFNGVVGIDGAASAEKTGTGNLAITGELSTPCGGALVFSVAVGKEFVVPNAQSNIDVAGNGTSPFGFLYGITQLAEKEVAYTFSGTSALASASDDGVGGNGKPIASPSVRASTTPNYWALMIVAFKTSTVNCPTTVVSSQNPTPSQINTNVEVQGVSFNSQVVINGLAQFYGSNSLLSGSNLTTTDSQLSSVLTFHQHAEPLKVVNQLRISIGTQLSCVITEARAGNSIVDVEVAKFGALDGSFERIIVEIQDPATNRKKNTIQNAQSAGCVVNGDPVTNNALGTLVVSVPVSCPVDERSAEQSGGGSLSIAAIVGIAVGGVCLIAIIVIVIVGIQIRNRKRREHIEAMKSTIQEANSNRLAESQY